MNLEIGGIEILASSQQNIAIDVGETFTGQPIKIQAHIWAGQEPGPVVLISGAIHGDEINGSGIVRELIRSKPFKLKKGVMVLVPVINVMGFEQRSRYMPDRRDLNRFFPGKEDGSLTSRFARVFFDEIVKKCSYVIDLHAAAWTRTNFPNLRANLGDPETADLAESMGCEVLLDSKGPEGSLRRACAKANIPAIVLEAGEVNKVEPSVVEFGVRLVTGALHHLGMTDQKGREPLYTTKIKRSTWVRANMGGLMDFHVAPGDIVDRGQQIATNLTLLGEEQNSLYAPFGGIVLGMTTLPSVMAGDPVIHLGQPVGGYRKIKKLVEEASSKHLHERMRTDLQTNLVVSDIEES